METNNNIATLRLAARPGASLDEFNVYYLAFKNHMGLVKVKLSPAEMRMPSNHLKSIAEVKALEYLLVGIEVLSEGRKGDSVQITATSKSIKEIMQINSLSKPVRDRLLFEAKSLKYIKGTNLPIYLYRAMCGLMSSTISRFLAAKIIISDDIKWIKPVVPEKNIHHHVASHKIMQRVDINGIGKLSITTHAFDQFVRRSKVNSPEQMWAYFLSILRSPTLQLTPYPEDIADYNLEKYGTLALCYYCSNTRWYFTVVEVDNELVLITSFRTEANLYDYSKR